MKLTTKKIYESFLVVEGAGDFPLDMLRYDSACPYREVDSHAMAREGRRRLALVRRAVNSLPATHARWLSFGWTVIADSADACIIDDAVAGKGPWARVKDPCRLCGEDRNHPSQPRAGHRC